MSVTRTIHFGMTLSLLTGLISGCASSGQQADYPIPFVGSRVTKRPRHIAVTTGVSGVHAAKVARYTNATYVDQHRSSRSVGLNRYQKRAGRKSSSSIKFGSQPVTRRAGASHIAARVVGRTRSATSVGQEPRMARRAGVDSSP